MRTLLLMAISTSIFWGQKIFTPQNLSEYLTDSNPYVSTLLNREKIAKQKIGFYEGAFDTTLSGKADQKEYPATTGEYGELFLKKRFENGLQLYSGYRRSVGTQEYNNIKTGKSGEMQLALKLPVVELLQGTNSHKVALEVAKIGSQKQGFGSKNGIRLLYLNALSSYYILLHSRAVFGLQDQLLSKAKNRRSYIKKRVDNGLLPQLSLLEVEQQIINRQQRLFSAKTVYENSLANFLKYLNLSESQFFSLYRLSETLPVELIKLNFETALETARKNRPDLKMLYYDRQKLQVEREGVNNLRFPSVNLTLYGVHDIKYGNGFKVALGMDFPVERSKYHSKVGEYRQSLQNVDEVEKKMLFEIEATLKNIIGSLNILRVNMDSAEREIVLVKRLEEAENRKYKLGSSNLFMLNQREMYTLNTEKKLLDYKLKYLLWREQLKSEVGGVL
jgi:outer membrane protein TolC